MRIGPPKEKTLRAAGSGENIRRVKRANIWTGLLKIESMQARCRRRVGQYEGGDRRDRKRTKPRLHRPPERRPKMCARRRAGRRAERENNATRGRAGPHLLICCCGWAAKSTPSACFTTEPQKAE